MKLGNILLNADKHVTLSDFGIAHIFGDGMVKAPAGACVTDAFCASGRRTVLGTDCYMAPEVAEGGEATPASDTYALGVAMFRLLTGVWYEPGMDPRALLAGRKWKYRWADVLPASLSPLLDCPCRERRASLGCVCAQGNRICGISSSQENVRGTSEEILASDVLSVCSYHRIYKNTVVDAAVDDMPLRQPLRQTGTGQMKLWYNIRK